MASGTDKWKDAPNTAYKGKPPTKAQEARTMRVIMGVRALIDTSMEHERMLGGLEDTPARAEFTAMHMDWNNKLQLNYQYGTINIKEYHIDEVLARLKAELSTYIRKGA